MFYKNFIFLFVVLILIPFSFASNFNDLQDSFLVVKNIDGARKDIESAGGIVTHIFPEDKILIGKISKNFKSRNVRKIYFEGDRMKNDDFLYSVWEKSLEKEDKPIKDIDPIYEDVISEEKIELSDLEYQMKRLPSGNALPTDTSLYMIGDISVGVITPESIGGSEDWTQQELTEVYSEVMNGLAWWSNLNPNAHLTFTYHFEEQVPTTYEPIEEGSIYRHYWGPEVLFELGHGDGEGPVTDDVYDYVNYLRDEDSTDWGFVVFVVDSSNDFDGAFSDGKFAFTNMYSSGGGPYMTMTYDNYDYGINN